MKTKKAQAIVLALSLLVFGATLALAEMVQGTTAINTSPATAPNPVLQGGWDGTTLRAIKVNANGTMIGNGEATGGSAYAATANFLPVGGTDGTNGRMLSVVPTNTNPGSNPATLIVGGLDTGNAVRAVPTVVGTTAMTTANVFMAIGGSDGANARLSLTDPAGRSTLGDTSKATYSAASVSFVPASGATDVITITGSASKTVKVRRLSLSPSAGTFTFATVRLIKRSSADTAGTFVADTAIPHDSTDSAATVTVGHYTANPTLGGTVGDVSDTVVNFNVLASGVAPDRLVLDFSTRADKGIVLNGVAQQLAVNLNSTAFTSPVLVYSIEWTEE